MPEQGESQDGYADPLNQNCSNTPLQQEEKKWKPWWKQMTDAPAAFQRYNEVTHSLYSWL